MRIDPKAIVCGLVVAAALLLGIAIGRSSSSGQLQTQSAADVTPAMRSITVSQSLDVADDKWSLKSEQTVDGNTVWNVDLQGNSRK